MVKIALLGLGTVGTGVAEILKNNAEIISERLGEKIDLAYILTRSPRPDSPWADRIIQDFDIIERDSEVRLVAECMGGTQPALDYVRRSLQAGKQVVTSNKELVAGHGYPLIRLAEQNNLNFLFEASVGGGIPILRPLTTCLAANNITGIAGIINGTTNFILTKMYREGLDYAQALEQAQQLGYAEADPTADVQGLDAARKICILAALAFGRHIYPDQVLTRGITALGAEDTAFAEAAGCRIRLLARASLLPDGRVCALTAPHLVPKDQLLADVEDVFNAVQVQGDAVGDVIFYGRGAGKLPTASAVVADMIDALRHTQTRRPLMWRQGGPDAAADAGTQPLTWFVRTDAEPGRIRQALGEVRFVSADVPGQTGFFVGPISQKQLHAAGLPILGELVLYRPGDTAPHLEELQCH